jgi:hypothetical protein
MIDTASRPFARLSARDRIVIEASHAAVSRSRAMLQRTDELVRDGRMGPGALARGADLASQPRV